MNFLSEMSELSDVSKQKNYKDISKEYKDKFDKIMHDDHLDKIKPNPKEEILTPEESQSKFDSLFDSGDFFVKDLVSQKNVVHLSEKDNTSETNESKGSTNHSEITEQEPDYTENREPNSIYEINGNIYETDDDGHIYKKNGELLPNTEYTINGNKYKTDERGNKISCDSNPEYTEEGSRNLKEQKESGGDERKEDDEGGHIIARILGGADGEENLIPMRRTINRGDYKRMENEIAKALQEGKKVAVHIDIVYDSDSNRPSKIRVEYTIDGKKTICEFDNVEGSTNLLDSLKDMISDEDYDRLKQTLKDMNEDGCTPSVTSVKVEYDEEGKPVKVTIGVLDESTGTKTYKVYEPKQE